MKKRVKLVALCLATVMLLTSFTGCNKIGPQDVEKTAAQTSIAENDSSSESLDDSDATQDGIDGWKVFDEKVTLKIPIYDRGVEGVPTVNNNYWTKWVQENFGDKYNITVEYVPITRTDVMTDYALLAASGDLPTILMEYDYPKVAQWADEGYLTTFNMDEFAKIAPTYYNRMSDGGQLPYTVMNGETYFALAERTCYNNGYTFQSFVRMDWLKKVGYDHVPRTRAEYVDAMTKIQNAGIAEHPAGGAMITGVGSDQNYGFRTFPQNEEEWARTGDVNIPALGSEANYKFLKRANEDYNLGFTNPEYYITDEETNKASFINGNTYSYGNYISANMDWLNSFYEQNPDAELAVSPTGIIDEDGGTVPAYRSNNPFGMIIGFSSDATEDELKAGWMYMEWMTQEDVLFAMQWGVEGENYTVDATTKLPLSVGDYSGDYKQGYNNNKDYWCITIEARNAGTIEDMIQASSPKGLPQDFTQSIINNFQGNEELIEQGYSCLDIIFSVPIEAETEFGGVLQELYKEYRDQLTMCKTEEFDDLYKELTQEYMDAGYKEVMSQRIQTYKDGHSTKLQ
ncbi:MAG: extracellular solute-binding protein [Lachnotalea sp.]